MGVRYKIVEGFPKYRVGTDGSVWRFVDKFRRWRRLKPGIKNNGYRLVTLSKGGIKKYATVHRLVLITFTGEPPEGKPLALHKNGHKTDNRLVNLKWGSYKDNCDDSRLHGDLPEGERIGSSVLTEEKVISARRRVKEGEEINTIARELNVDNITLWCAVRGKSWKYLNDVESPPPKVRTWKLKPNKRKAVK